MCVKIFEGIFVHSVQFYEENLSLFKIPTGKHSTFLCCLSMFLLLSVCLYVLSVVCLFACLPVSICVCVCVSVSMCVCVCLSVCLWLSVCPSVCLCLRLFMSPCRCLSRSVCLSLWDHDVSVLPGNRRLTANSHRSKQRGVTDLKWHPNTFIRHVHKHTNMASMASMPTLCSHIFVVFFIICTLWC